MNRKRFGSLILASALLMEVLGSSVHSENLPESFPKSLPAEVVMPPNGEPSSTAVGASGSALGRVFGVEGKGGDIEYYSVDMFNHSPANAAWRSALVPGWGQMFNEQKSKGYLMMGTALATGLGSIILYRNSQDTYDEYTSTGLRDGSKYDDYEKQHNQSLFLGGLTAVIWGVSIFDAYRNAYNALWSSKSPAIQIVAKLDGAELQWRKKF